jgi:hypothetical protein
MEAVVKATISVDNKVITFEGPQEFVNEQVAKYMSLAQSSNTSDNSIVPRQSGDVSANPVLTEKQLVMTKKPKAHSETVAVLAFALGESGKAEFTEEDMRKAYIRAGVRPPKVVGQAIRDAKNKSEFIEAGSKWGTYKLSSHGDRTVRFDLPHSSGAKE